MYSVVFVCSECMKDESKPVFLNSKVMEIITSHPKGTTSEEEEFYKLPEENDHIYLVHQVFSEHNKWF